MSVLLETSLGDLVVDLHVDETPRTSRNFLKLCQLKYYNHCHIFRVERDFLVQAGDPDRNDGSAGRSVYGALYGEQADLFEGECTPALRHDRFGTLSMTGSMPSRHAQRDPTDDNDAQPLHGSQFFITTSQRGPQEWLDGHHTVFGRVVEGRDVLERINRVFVDENNGSRPFQVIRIHHTIILHDPFAHLDTKLPGFVERIPPTSPLISLSDLEDERTHRVAEDELVGQNQPDSPTRRTHDARSRAEVLEMIGDIADADMKPPDNVLFVCKLNPVTTEEDLELIFSRFSPEQGQGVAVNVIRDYKTGDSLCYGFIEFPDSSSCERAYYKMDNTLIDDRRVRVDFSQSVPRLWNEMRRTQRRTPHREQPRKHNPTSRKGNMGVQADDGDPRPLVFDLDPELRRRKRSRR